MKLSDIRATISFQLWVIPLFDSIKIKKGIGKIKPSELSGEYNLIINKNLIKIKLRDSHQQNNLDFHLKRGGAHLTEVTQIAKDETAYLNIVFFAGNVIEIEEIEVGIDEKIEKTAKRNKISFGNTTQLGKLLNDKSVIKVGDETYFLIISGIAADADFDYKKDNETDNESVSVPSLKSTFRQFSIYGDRIRIPVEKRRLNQFSSLFFATKLITKTNNNKEGALRLVKGKITFTDLPERIKAVAAGEMSRLIEDSGSYLNKWDEYGDKEGEILLKKARAVGKIKYTNAEKTAKGVKFFINPDCNSDYLEVLSEGDQLEITSEIPSYIHDKNITWAEYIKTIEASFSSGVQHQGEGKEDRIKPIFSTIIKLSDKSIVLDIPDIPSSHYLFIILSISGDKVQIERRMKARKLILEGRSANPYLGLLIEENGEIPNIQRIPKKLKPLTPFVKEKIFKHDPTERQKKAIDIALNTPDIVLIQGPPGTGKTTVITAILERLNEEHDKTHSIRGQILVSGFQHDAVENIISRLSINALPAVKFGGKASASNFSEDQTSKKIEEWRKRLVGKIRSRNPQISKTEEQRKLSDFFVLYSISPSLLHARNLLQLILDLPRSILTKALSDKTTTLLKQLKKNDVSIHHEKLRVIRSLRLSKNAFLDDGCERAFDFLEYFDDQLNATERLLLKQAAQWKKQRKLDFLHELKILKKKFIEQYISKPHFSIEKPREDILGLIAEVSQQLDREKNRENKHNRILADFLHELENNPHGVREAIEDYNYIFAATTQQAEGKAIRRAKKKYKDDSPIYDTVIIDEAARVSPRDLLIPLSQAEKRIILVGDHRQLPHLIDDEVVKSLDSDENDFVEKSMFEYLFKRLKALEKQDRIKRTITLDAQFRTHPLLGDFCSQNFYEQYGEAYRSPLPEHYFSQELSHTKGKSALWLNVPNSKGQEGKAGFSRKREAEAEAIARQLSEWIDSEAGKMLSFGVISFYKAQVNAVFKALSKYNITEYSNGSWRCKKSYQSLTNDEERLRIGTVDSFQGMEFDVVFLSMVRTQNLEKLRAWQNRENNDEKIKRGVFGHLMSENRLCVSMSRQKKVLVMVGDGELVQTEITREAVPALANYYDLCRKQGVIL